MLEINSKTNKTYKMLCALRTKKGRTEHRLYTVEGVKSVEEALTYASGIAYLVLTKEVLHQQSALVSAAEAKGIAVCLLTEDLFAKISDTQTPSGILCALKLPTDKTSELHGGLYIYCDRIADPGNAGTIIRTADAVGASAVWFSPECVDIYNPKVIRSTMGSFFHIETRTDVDMSVLKTATDKGYACIAGALSPTATDARTMQMPKDTVLVIGNESNGVSSAVLDLCPTHAILPIVGKAESLNAATAAGVFMYKWLFEQF